MYGKKWTTANGVTSEIEHMEEQHLINAANMTYRNFRVAAEGYKYSYIQTLFNLVQELEYREVDDDDYDAPSLDAIMDLARKYHVTLIIGGAVRSPASKPIRRMTKEEEEKLWQETEAKILPEGDRHTLVLNDFYCNVDRITRRISQIYGDDNMPALYKDSIPTRPEAMKKKVKITIEVLEN